MSNQSDKPKVTIRHAGNLLEISPAMEDVLGHVLTYNHVYTVMGHVPGTRNTVETVPRALYKVTDNKMVVMHGVRQRIFDTLKTKNIPYEYIDMRKASDRVVPDYDNLVTSIPDIQFRFKQDEVLANIVALDMGQIIAPTAYGKTFIITAVISLFPKANIIIVSPSVSLLNSTFRRIQEVTLQVGMVGGGNNKPDRVTLTTPRSLLRCDVQNCDILLIDECHKVAAKKTSVDLIKVRHASKIFGLTATPEGRADNAELITESLVGPEICRVTYQEAVSAKMVSNLKVLMMPLDITTCAVNSSSWTTKVAKKRNVYWRNTARNAAFVNLINSFREHCGIKDPQILVLAETVEHALRLHKRLPDFTVVHGNLSPAQKEKFVTYGLIPDDYKSPSDKDRIQYLADFEAGRLRRVIATGMWGTGIDCVYLDALVNISGMRSPIDTLQWAGRSSRINDSKRTGYILDSRDLFDSWAAGRAVSRMQTYRKAGFEIVKLKVNSIIAGDEVFGKPCQLTLIDESKSQIG